MFKFSSLFFDSWNDNSNDSFKFESSSFVYFCWR